MKKVWLFSYYLPTQPLLEVPLYGELIKSGATAEYVLLDNDPRIIKNAGLPKSIIKISKPKQLASIMGKEDLLVCRFGYKDIIGEICCNIKPPKQIMMYDVGGVDIFFRDVPATHITAKTAWYKEQALKKIKKKYKNIFTTGSIQFDDIFNIKNKKIDKKEFLKKYGLDPSKKLAILTPANPGEAWQKGIQEDYRKIVETVSKLSDYELMIKGHPSDYRLSKSQHYGGKHSWEVFAPKAKVVFAEEGYDALAVCDVVLNIRSSLSIEIPALYKPLININSDKYVVNWPKSDNPGVMKNIDISNLQGVLMNKEFFVDKKECDKYTKQYCDEYMDGKAYARMAKEIVNLL